MENKSGLIFDIRRFALEDGPGVRTTIFFKGCPLRCSWCYNPEARVPSPVLVEMEVRSKTGSIEKKDVVVGEYYNVDNLMKILCEERAVMDISEGGVTFSGGEPAMQHEFLLETLKRCKSEGLHTALDTNGCTEPDVLFELLPFVDLFLYDLKHGDSDKHLEYTAVSNVKIINNLYLILEKGAKVWVRIPIIPGFNYCVKAMKEIIELLKEMPDGIEQVNLLPFKQTASDKYKRLGYLNVMEDISSLPKSKLKPFRRLFRRAGFTTIIGG